MFATKFVVNMRKIIFVVALLPFLTSCHLINNHQLTQFEILEQQINQNPEQVLAKLRQIDPEILCPSQKAHYYLLNASALDKNLKYLENDSTLQIALHFYQAHPDDYQLARCHYYLGKYSLHKQHFQNAYDLFSQAERYLQTSEKTDVHFQGLICYQLSKLLHYQGHLKEALAYSESALDHFQSIQDTIATIYALKLKGLRKLETGDTLAARHTFQQALKLISHFEPPYSEKVFQAQIAIYSAFSQYYGYTTAIPEALFYSRKCIKLFTQYNKAIPSGYYKDLLNLFQKQQNRDSIRIYGKKMIEASLQEKNNRSLSFAYQILAETEKEEGQYQTAYELRVQSGQLKDSLYNAINKQRYLELKEHNTSLQQRLKLKDENEELKNIRLFLIILFSITIAGLCFYYRHHQLQLENNQLSERIKHTSWGFSVTQEFIRQNHIAFHQLTKILNQEKLVGNISIDIYNLLYQTLIKQNADYSGNLMNRLTNLDGAFAQKFQEHFPNFHTDEILMATMIHHKWKLTQMATIFQTTPEAIRKRRQRLLSRIAGQLQTHTDPEEFLIHL